MDNLREMAGIRLCESTIQRTTEDVGQRLVALQQDEQTVGPVVQWDWQRDAAETTVAYISIDATGTRQQGQGSRCRGPYGICRGGI